MRTPRFTPLLRSAKQSNKERGQNGNPSSIIGRNEFLFTVGTIAVVTAVLFPLSAHILDVFLGFSISLTAAALIITFSARGALEVSGFPLLIVLATMLRMALSVASAKLILLQGDGGTIISFFGAIFVRDNYAGAILIFGVLTLVIFGTICKAVKNIIRTARDFITDIAPIKQLGIENDVSTGIINKSQALELRGKIAREASFFVGMAGAGRFMLCSAVIELVIVIVNITVLMAQKAVGGTTIGTSVKTYTILAVGAGMVTEVSALLAAVASGYLVRKSTVAAANDGISEQEFAERIKVVANEADSRAVELGSLIKVDKKMIVEDLEWFDEQRADENEKDELNSSLWEEIKDSNCYEAIAELIKSKPAETTKTILTAAESVEELGVTVPVNIAMRLAKRGRKCLLIDLDSQRSAISKVFDIAPPSSASQNKDRGHQEAIATCIDNLWVWQGEELKIVSELENRYDHLIIYAPTIKPPRFATQNDGEGGADCERIASCVGAAMLFKPKGSGIESSYVGDFCELLISYGCEILKPAEVFARA